MADKIQIGTDLKSLLSSKLGEKLKQVILFGSQASGEPGDTSDFDFLIILTEKPDGELRRKISDYCYEIDLKYGIFTDVHILGEEELNTLQGKQSILQMAIQDGIYV